MTQAPVTKPSSVEALARKGLKRAKNDRTWDWLREISTNVRHYLAAPAVLLPMLNDPILIASIAQQQKAPLLTDLIRRLGRDVQAYTDRFQALANRHSARRGSSSDPDDMMHSITISQDYLHFMSSYESVVMPTISEILELMDQAGLDTSTIRALANGGLVYDLYQSSAA